MAGNLAPALLGQPSRRTHRASLKRAVPNRFDTCMNALRTTAFAPQQSRVGRAAGHLQRLAHGCHASGSLPASSRGGRPPPGLGYLIFEAIAAAGFRPNYSYAHDFISNLGVTSPGMFQGRMINSPLAYLINAAFNVQGTLFLAGAFLIVRAFETRKAALFLTPAATNAVGNFLVATVHSGPIAQANGTSWVHAGGALLAILGGNAAILAGSFS